MYIYICICIYIYIYICIYYRWHSAARTLGGTLRSVFIISNRRISNWAYQILKRNMLFMCPYCLKFQIARVKAAEANMKFWKLTVEHFRKFLELMEIVSSGRGRTSLPDMYLSLSLSLYLSVSLSLSLFLSHTDRMILQPAPLLWPG